MSIDVTVNGRRRTVLVDPQTERPGEVAVTVEGRRRVFDLSWIDADTLSMIEGGVACEIRLHKRENGAVGVEIDGTVYEVLVSAPKPLREPFSVDSGKKAPGAVSTVAIKAPMPGRIVRVLVAAGDRVAARQGLVVVEAMKMENELRAPRDGTVKEIRAAAGAVVESGAVLVIIGD